MVSHGGGREFKGTDFLYLKCKGLKFSITVVVKIKNCRVLVEPPAEERWSGLLGRWLLVCSVAARCRGGGAGKKPAGGHSPTTTTIQSSSAARRAPCTVQCNYSATAACMIVGFSTTRRASTVRQQHIEHNSEPYTLSEP